MQPAFPALNGRTIRRLKGIRPRRQLGLVAITARNFCDSFAYLSAFGSEEARWAGSVTEAAFLGVHMLR